MGRLGWVRQPVQEHAEEWWCRLRMLQNLHPRMQHLHPRSKQEQFTWSRLHTGMEDSGRSKDTALCKDRAGKRQSPPALLPAYRFIDIHT